MRRADAVARWAPAVVWMVAIFLLSDQPGLALSDDPAVDGPIRRVAHIAAYAMLTVLLARAFGAGGFTPRLALAATAAVLYGVTDEIHQSFVPDRSGNPTDVLVDAIGALIGAVVARRWRPFRHLPPKAVP